MLLELCRRPAYIAATQCVVKCLALPFVPSRHAYRLTTHLSATKQWFRRRCRTHHPGFLSPCARPRTVFFSSYLRLAYCSFAHGVLPSTPLRIHSCRIYTAWQSVLAPTPSHQPVHLPDLPRRTSCQLPTIAWPYVSIRSHIAMLFHFMCLALCMYHIPIAIQQEPDTVSTSVGRDAKTPPYFRPPVGNTKRPLADAAAEPRPRTPSTAFRAAARLHRRAKKMGRHPIGPASLSPVTSTRVYLSSHLTLHFRVK